MSEVKTDVTEIVREIAKLPRNMDIDPKAELPDLGVDSLEVVNVFLMITERYGIDISDDEIDQLTTIDQISEHLEKQLAQR